MFTMIIPLMAAIHAERPDKALQRDGLSLMASSKSAIIPLEDAFQYHCGRAHPPTLPNDIWTMHATRFSPSGSAVGSDRASACTRDKLSYVDGTLCLHHTSLFPSTNTYTVSNVVSLSHGMSPLVFTNWMACDSVTMSTESTLPSESARVFPSELLSESMNPDMTAYEHEQQIVHTAGLFTGGLLGYWSFDGTTRQTIQDSLQPATACNHTRSAVHTDSHCLELSCNALFSNWLREINVKSEGLSRHILSCHMAPVSSGMAARVSTGTGLSARAPVCRAGVSPP